MENIMVKNVYDKHFAALCHKLDAAGFSSLCGSVVLLPSSSLGWFASHTLVPSKSSLRHC